MKHSEQINELAAALAKAQSEIKDAAKDSANPFFKSKYADLASVWDACRTPLSKNNLSVVQTAETDAAGIVLHTLLLHASGQWISGTLCMTPVKSDPQGIGSCVTYARRYALSAMVGIAPSEDDGNAATGIVVPEQPAHGDGVQNFDGGYRIPFGKFAKRTLEEVDLNELRNYIAYLERDAAKKGGLMSPNVADFVSRASLHVAALENGAIQE